MNYLQKRGLSLESIRAFKLGLCTNRIDYSIENKGLNKDKLIELGVLGKSDKKDKTYLRFLDRIMFPIYSPSAQVVGFGGRTLKEKRPSISIRPKISFLINPVCSMATIWLKNTSTNKSKSL